MASAISTQTFTFSKGATSRIIQVFIANSASTTGAGLSGLVYNSASLQGFYNKDTDTGSTVITLVTMTAGTWVSGGFVEIDGTNMAGWYQLGLPDAVLASGTTGAVILKGATNMAPTPIMISLTTPVGFVKNNSLSNFEFYMVSASDHITPKTGASVTAQRSIDGAALANCTNGIFEVGSGLYKINLSAADLNGDTITFMFTASGADTVCITVKTQT